MNLTIDQILETCLCGDAKSRHDTEKLPPSPCRDCPCEEFTPVDPEAQQ